MNIILKEVEMPTLSENVVPVDLTKETMDERKDKLLNVMQKRDLDTVIIYADREHGSNFEYFTGFIPRFEEALLVVHKDGRAFLLLGNENTKMVNYSRIKAELIHVPFFSLPNQPMENDETLENIFKQADIKEGSQVAVIGWKNFTSTFEENKYLYDVPYFIIDTLKKLIKNDQNLVNGCDLLISPKDGIRTINNANEIAHYEYGETLAGIGVLNTINHIAIGKTELELANHLLIDGQPNSITTVCATGDRFTNATLYPRDKQVKMGDKFSTSVGYKGGLSSRAAYVANNQEDMPILEKDYEEVLAKPYYKAIATWLETIKVGLDASEMYDTIETVLPKDVYHWELNPGHFVADEEWMSSPFYPNSTASVKSGQLFQIDIIPKIAGYGGVGCEDGVAIANETLREELKKNYPDTWSRISKRQTYIKDVLNINISEDVLPLNDVVAYYRPYLLNHSLAFSVE